MTRPSSPPDDPTSADARGGLLLLAATGLALLAANGPAAPAYHAILKTALGPLTVHGWIDDGLMALFFLGVGLEVKGALIGGELADPRSRALPVAAAIGGMIVPAILYLLLAPGAVRGWAIPVATDIAFAQGILALAGGRVSPALRLLLTSIAIADDIGAVAIIAIAYTPAIDLTALAIAACLTIAMVVLGRRGERRLWPFLVLAALLWIAIWQSGVHATIAGVIAAFAIPLGDGDASPARRLERRLHPIVAFAVVPLFAFANAGLALDGIGPAALAAPVPLAIALALVLGKPAGVLAGIALIARRGRAAIPAGIGRRELCGMALLCWIGFTMSLFIGALAFDDPATLDAVRLGVLAGSTVSALAGIALLRLARR